MIAQYLRSLWAGIRLSLLGRPLLDPQELTPGMLWLFALLGMLLSCGLSYLGTEPPRLFVYDGLLLQSYDLAITLLIGFLLARAFVSPAMMWRLPVLLMAAGLLPLTMSYLTYDFLLPRWANQYPKIYFLHYGLMQLWWVGILYQALSTLVGEQPVMKRATLAVYTVGLVALLAYPLSHQQFWERDFAEIHRQQQKEQPKPLVAESVFARQPQLLADAIAQLRDGEAGKTELYFLGFGGDGRQKVFMREVRYVEQQFQQRFGAAGRVLALVNDRDQPEQQPMASVSNLEHAMQAIAQRMNVEEDILFLFLTSHGSKTHELSVDLGGIGLLQLSADALARMLRESAIRWRVIVISACYSGGFIDTLKGDTTLVIASARTDRKSFGCKDTEDFTYFGRAYFEQALNQTHSFSEAFRKAQLLVRQWETKDKYDPSEPQISVGALMEDKLAEWVSGLPTPSQPEQPASDVMVESTADLPEKKLHVDAPRL